MFVNQHGTVISYYLSKNWPASPFTTKIWKKVPHESTFLNSFSEYIRRQLKKYYQYGIRSFVRNYSKCLWITYSITCSTKVLTLAIARFLFVLVGVLCELSMVLVMHFYCPLRKKRYIIFPEGRDVHNQQHVDQKDLNLCLTL